MRVAFTLTLTLTSLPGLARADEPPEDMTPCQDPLIDPIVTPVRDAQLDAQRSACMRNDITAGLRAHALVDTPGFHGVLGGDLELGRHIVIAKAHELSAAITFVNYTFVQTAVNKITHTGFGPVVLGGAAGKAIGTGARAAVSLRFEVPFTHDGSDTVRSSAQLLGLVSASLSPRITLHARLGSMTRVASSLGGETYRLAFGAGSDLVWHPRTRLALQLGLESMAGWDGGLDHVLARAGVQWRMRGGAWHLRAGAGVPIAGNERTNAILDVAIVVDR